MNRTLATTFLAFSMLGATGCAKKAVAPADHLNSNLTGYLGKLQFAPAAKLKSSVLGGNLALASFTTSPQRFIAERDAIQVVTPESQLESAWQSLVIFCGTIRCETVSSSITMRTPQSVPSGMVSLRVAPEDLQKLLSHLQSLGKIAQHTSERDDETTAVIDTEAKIKNLTAFRDNLRAMLARPSATTANVVEIDKQLTDTQAELDSETAQRKVLANETEKVAVEVSLRVPEVAGPVTNGLSEIWDSLRGAGSTLGDSLANLVTTIVFLIPWLLVLVPTAWLLIKAWQRSRKRAVPTTVPTALA